MPSTQVLARNVRRLRTERRLSLGELAERAGVAKQTIANLESGRGNPTVDTMLRTAEALGVGATWLLAEWGSPVAVRRARDAEWDSEPGARRWRMDEIFGTGQVAMDVLELSAHHKPREALDVGTMIHATVLTGRVIAGTVDDQQRLTAGDFIRFPGDVPHVLDASSGRAKVHVVTTIPRVDQFGPY